MIWVQVFDSERVPWVDHGGAVPRRPQCCASKASPHLPVTSIYVHVLNCLPQRQLHQLAPESTHVISNISYNGWSTEFRWWCGKFQMAVPPILARVLMPLCGRHMLLHSCNKKIKKSQYLKSLLTVNRLHTLHPSILQDESFLSHSNLERGRDDFPYSAE